MRTYLFVDLGNGPRVVARWDKRRPTKIDRMGPAEGQPSWFLVECESAEAGRYLIENVGKRDPRDLIVAGRILDSGGVA